MSLDVQSLDNLIRSRRTTKLLDPDTPVDRATIAELCELATWAPNHRRTEPWRFAVFTGEGRARLGETIAEVLTDNGAHHAAITKTRTKYFRASTVIVVGANEGPDPITTAENRDAVAAAIQILLLSAHARGLATLWSTVSTPTAPELLDLCGFERSAFCAGAIHLGHPTGVESPGHRSAAIINLIDA